MNKKVASGIMAAGLIATSIVAFTGCGNKDLTDMHYTFNYVVLEENDEHVLHKVKSWADSDSESVTITCECCDNYIWSSVNRAVMYKNKPAASAYDKVCEQWVLE